MQNDKGMEFEKKFLKRVISFRETFMRLAVFLFRCSCIHVVLAQTNLISSYTFNSVVNCISIYNGDVLIGGGSKFVRQLRINGLTRVDDYSTSTSVKAMTADILGIVIGSTDNSVLFYLWGSKNPSLNFNSQIAVNAVATTAYYFLSAHGDGTVKLWSKSTYTFAGVINAQDSPLLCLTTHFADNYMYACSGTLVLGYQLDIPAMAGGGATVTKRQSVYQEFVPLFKTESILFAITFGAGYVFAAGGSPFSIYQWDPQTEIVLKRFNGHTEQINALTATNVFLFSGSNDKTIRQWHIASSQLVGIFSGHTGNINSLSIVDDLHLMSGSDDKTVRRWRILEFSPNSSISFAVVATSTLSITTIATRTEAPTDVNVFPTDFTTPIPKAVFLNNTDLDLDKTTKSSTIVTSTETLQSIRSSLLILAETISSSQSSSSVASVASITLRNIETPLISTKLYEASISSSVTNDSLKIMESSKNISTGGSINTDVASSTSSHRLATTALTEIVQKPTSTHSPTTFDGATMGDSSLFNYVIIGFSVVITLSASIALLAYLKLRNIKQSSDASDGPRLFNSGQELENRSSTIQLTSCTFPSERIASRNSESDSVPSTKSAASISVESNKTSSRFTSVGVTSTLISTNRQGLYVPGNYLLDPNMALYKPVNMIYSNHNCEVYIAEVLSEELKRRCYSKKIAVKLTKKLTAKFVDSFYQEVSLMYYFVGKPNFVQLVGFCNSPYQIMSDYYSLGNLSTALLYRKSVEPSKNIAIRFTLQISSALALMHQSGFAHADIKALNIFVDRDSSGQLQCYLGDFGLAQVLDDSHLVVKAYHVFNQKGLTITYAAPEVLQRFRAKDMAEAMQNWHPDDFKRADSYSFSILMYEILSGQVAW